MNFKKSCLMLALGATLSVWAQVPGEGKVYLISNLTETEHFIQDTGKLTFGLPGSKALWRFIPTENENCFYIQNVATQNYMQSSKSVGQAVLTGSNPVEYIVIQDDSRGSTRGGWGLASTDQEDLTFKTVNTIGLNDNEGGFVAGYPARQSVNTRSFWKFEEAMDDLPEEDFSNRGMIYYNPVIRSGAPDPTVIRAENGYYYLYATENPVRNVPIYKSLNLTNWELVGTVFNNSNRPDFVNGGAIWAPSINYSDGKYYLYYSVSRWGGEWDCGIGVATADDPEGPFTNHGKMFISSEHDTQNSIDPCFFEEDGKKYLFWGSFRGIWCAELTADGLNIQPSTIRRVAGTLTEGTYIVKHDGYYYLIGSAGSCCDGQNSTYHLMVARSENILGPYVNKEGGKALDNQFSHLLYRNDAVIGPGHNAEFVQDDAGEWWMLYHGWVPGQEDLGRVVYLDRINWSESGWPSVRGMEPSKKAIKPVINSNKEDAVVEVTQAEGEDSHHLYNLQGIQVNSDYKGIVLKNGKKSIRFYE